MILQSDELVDGLPASRVHFGVSPVLLQTFPQKAPARHNVLAKLANGAFTRPHRVDVQAYVRRSQALHIELCFGATQ
jgi:hypothetical protein